METTTRARRAERDLLRAGRPAVEHHWIPERWAEAFANGPEAFAGEDDERWNEAAATRFEAQITERGYLFAGTTGAEPEEFGQFEGQCGPLVQVAFTDQKTFDADEAAGVFCVIGCDDGPTEYVVRRSTDAVVRLPANFEQRLLDPDQPVDDPSTNGTLPAFLHTSMGESGPEHLRKGCADPEEIDRKWTDEAADAVALALAGEGWTIEQALSATTRQGWVGDLYGNTILFVVTRDRIDDARVPTAAAMGAVPETIAARSSSRGV